MAHEPASSSQPLLHEDRHLAAHSAADRSSEEHDPSTSTFKVRYNRFRQRQQKFLSSKVQHYIVLSLVSVDLLSIFADIFITLYTCEEGNGNLTPALAQTRQVLGIIGLVISCLFLLEFLASIWAFGTSYFHSAFHIFDGLVILLGFVVDVLLHGVLEEIASLVVILRLWRFFKIIEEFSVGAQEQMDVLEAKIERLEMENRKLKGNNAGENC